MFHPNVFLDDAREGTSQFLVDQLARGRYFTSEVISGNHLGRLGRSSFHSSGRVSQFTASYRQLPRPCMSSAAVAYTRPTKQGSGLRRLPLIAAGWCEAGIWTLVPALYCGWVVSFTLCWRIDGVWLANTQVRKTVAEVVALPVLVDHVVHIVLDSRYCWPGFPLLGICPDGDTVRLLAASMLS